MGHVVSPGWYVDPSRTHESRYWDGAHWTATVADGGTVSEDHASSDVFGPPGSGDRLALWALGLLLVGGAVALAASVVWATWMDIGSTVAETDRVRGWTAVLRSVPVAILAWAVPVAAMALAVRACRRGSTAVGRVVILLAGAVLFIVSVSILGDTPENLSSGSGPEWKWMLLPVSVVISAGATYLALRASRRQPG